MRFAKCCSPLPGDPIVGFITRGRGVTVHRRDCDKGLDLDPERRIDVEWDGTSKAQHEVAIQVLCADKPGLLAHISQSFTDQGVNISQAHCRATEDGRAVNTFHALGEDLDQLKQVIRSLSRIKGVFCVDRVSADVRASVARTHLRRAPTPALAAVPLATRDRVAGRIVSPACRSDHAARAHIPQRSAGASSGTRPGRRTPALHALAAV